MTMMASSENEVDIWFGLTQLGRGKGLRSFLLTGISNYDITEINKLKILYLAGYRLHHLGSCLSNNKEKTIIAQHVDAVLYKIPFLLNKALPSDRCHVFIVLH